MSTIEIRKIAPEGRELKKYVQFGIDLYDGNQWFVPPLVTDDTNTQYQIGRASCRERV